MSDSFDSPPRDIARRSALTAIVALPWLGACGTREKAPDFGYTLLDGRQGRTEALRGQVLLVNFWATTCAVCVAEMPRIVATHEKFRARGFETLAVAMQYDPPASVSMYAESRRLPFGVVIDNTGEIAKRYGPVTATPTTFLVDKRGAIAARWLGEPNFGALHADIEKLLAEV
jgi:peroxiredoxin